MSNRIKNIGIAGKFLAAIMVIAIILYGAVVYTQHFNTSKLLSRYTDVFVVGLEQQRQEQEQVMYGALVTKGEAVGALLANSGASCIVSYDFDSLLELAKNTCKDVDISSCVYYNDKGKALTPEPEELPENIRIIELPVTLEGSELGKVKLFLNHDSVNQAIQNAQTQTAALIENAQQEGHQSSMKALIVSIVSAVVGVLVLCLSVFLACKRLVVKPIQKTTDTLLSLANDFSSASSQVATSSQSLAQGATEQAAGLEETSSSLEEMSAMTKQNAENAMHANTLADQARNSAQSGSDAMSRMTDAINDIQKSSDETAKIIKVIDEIAFQTNLLALNAAVEAARAGEAGKGFAVVAEEVRNLAMRSAEAAKDTSSLIEESVKNSRNGVEISNDVGKILEEIVTNISKTSDLVGEINAASQEQAQGIDQVNGAVSQMDKVTQQNAANAEESASASEELNAQSESMNRIVDGLVTLIKGGRGNAMANGNTRAQRLPARQNFKLDKPVLEQKVNQQQKIAKVAVAQSSADEIPFDEDFSDFD